MEIFFDSIKNKQTKKHCLFSIYWYQHPIISRLFAGRFTENLKFVDDDENEMSRDITVEFRQIILGIAERDLYASLDEYSETEVKHFYIIKDQVLILTP